MGLFGKLFEKKECSICGGEIGLLGNRKLEDGNMCKHCANRLSPWFEDRRQSTIAQIKEQLAYREENQKAVSAFHVTRTFGEDWELRIDDLHGTFMIVRTSDIAEENPDVVALSQITGVELDIDENRTEETHEDKDGNLVSYSPPRYTYAYDFKLIIRVRHPYFDEMSFQLNDFTVRIESTPSLGDFFQGRFMGNPTQSYEYQKYEEMGLAAKEALLQSRSYQAAPQAQPAAGFCSNCGAPSNGGKFCQNCGSPLNQ